MRKYFTIAILALSINAFAQTPYWSGAQKYGSSGNDISNAVTVDASGNYFIAGLFESSSISFGSNVLNNSGGKDVFIVKHNQNGIVQWAKSATGSGNDVVTSITTDASNNVIITGYFQSNTITFGSVILTNTGGTDIFTVKYDSNGTLIWAKSAGGSTNEEATSVATDISGNIYITGFYESSSFSVSGSTLYNNGGKDVFFIKYNSAGNLGWAKSFGGISNDWGSSVAKDANGNIFLSGNFCSTTINFDTQILTNVNNAGSTEDIFAIKFDASGNVLWANSEGGGLNDVLYSSTVDNNGNLIVVGYFYNSTLVFGSISLGNAGGNKMFVGKYDSNGNVVWAKTVGWIGGNDYANAVSTDSNGDILVAGYYQYNPVSFDSWSLSNIGGQDIYAVKYNSSGVVQWAKNLGGTSNDMVTSLSTDSQDKFIMSGYFSSASIPFGSTTLTNSGGNDIFVTKLNSNLVVLPPSVAPASRCGSGTIVINASGASGSAIYRWFNTPTDINTIYIGASYTTPNLTQTDTIYVCIDSAGYRSSRIPAIATVNSLPTVSLASLNSVCVNANPFTLSGGLPSGGTYSGTSVSVNNFNPANAGVGTHTITYSVTNQYGCSATSPERVVTVIPTVIPTFTQVGPYSSGATIPALPTISTNNISGTWSPTINNTATTTYTFTPNAGQCVNATTMTIVINNPLSYSISATDTSICAGTTVTLSVNLNGVYRAGTVHCNATPTAVVDVTNPITGNTWMDRNLGASQVATSLTDAAAYGDLYQWGRGADGHQCRNSATTATLSSSDQPGHGDIISASITSPLSDWRSPQNQNLWQGVNGVNNPCPIGYRLPTETELNTEIATWGTINNINTFASVLKLPKAGRRADVGNLDDVGGQAYYWSSSVSGTNSLYLHFNSQAFMIDFPRACAYSIRCIKEAGGSIGATNCGPATNTDTLILGTPVNGVSGTISYTGGNSGLYYAQTVISTGITGLTANLAAGSFANGSGTLTYNITGTPSDIIPGYETTANFAINIGGQACTLSWPVSSALAAQYPIGAVFCAAGPTAIVDVTNPITGKTWMDRNLGASQVATSSTDAAAYGDLYQWGRGADGHQCRNSAYITSLSSNDLPGNANFITASTSPYDWRSPQNDNLWQGVNGINNPCPIGYRIPTELEMEAERLSWSFNNASGAFSSISKFVVAGMNLGYIDQVDGVGNYWTSTISSNTITYSKRLSFGIANTSNAGIGQDGRSIGFSIRCIKY